MHSSDKREDSGRRAVVPDFERAYLRVELLRVYGGEGDFTAAVGQALRHKWLALQRSGTLERSEPGRVLAGDPELLAELEYRGITGYGELAARYDREVAKEQAGQARDPALCNYVEALRGFVGDRMRLLENGQPARWALEAVHSTIKGFGGTSYNTSQRQRYHSNLELRLFETFAIASLTPGVELPSEEKTVSLAALLREGPDKGMQPRGVVERLIVGGTLGFDRWEMLAEVACGLVREEIERLRRDYEQDAQFANAARLDKDRDRLRILMEFLFHRRAVNRKAARDALRDMADKLGLHLPPFPRKSAEKSRH